MNMCLNTNVNPPLLASVWVSRQRIGIRNRERSGTGLLEADGTVFAEFCCSTVDLKDEKSLQRRCMHWQAWECNPALSFVLPCSQMVVFP